MAGLRLIVGLGNPGAEHLGTRHNAGFWFADALAQRQSSRFGIDAKLHAETTRIEIGGESLFLFKPITYMNKSGAAVAAALRYYKIEPEQMLIAHDDLDLPAGAVRLKFDGGHGGQNGLRDVFTHLGHGRFHRLRFGIGHPGHKDRVLSWVLGRPGRQDHQAIVDAVASAVEEMPVIVAGEYEKAMTRLHTSRD